jgi:hypothetical protein
MSRGLYNGAVKIKTPCCGTENDFPASSVLGKVVTADRLCKGCGNWWRLDVTCIKKEGAALFHKIEWTKVGKLNGGDNAC